MVQLFCGYLPANFRWWLPKVSAIFGLIWPYEVWDLSELLYLCNCDRMMWSQMSQSTTNIAINHKLHNQPQCHNSYLACHNTHDNIRVTIHIKILIRADFLLSLCQAPKPIHYEWCGIHDTEELAYNILFWAICSWIMSR